MKILITGATGLIGTQIVKDCLSNGIEVNFLTTSKNKIRYFKGCNGFYWHPKKRQIDLACFAGVNSIINLAGASIFRLWTAKNKDLILNSRVHCLNFLKDTIVENNIKIDFEEYILIFYFYNNNNIYNYNYNNNNNTN